MYIFSSKISLFPYSGHYIVVCGFNPDEKILYYKDPAVRNGMRSLNVYKVYFINNKLNYILFI